jgi:hypothetical protein
VSSSFATVNLEGLGMEGTSLAVPESNEFCLVRHRRAG